MLLCLVDLLLLEGADGLLQVFNRPIFDLCLFGGQLARRSILFRDVHRRLLDPAGEA